MPEPNVQFEDLDPQGDLEVLLEGIDEIPAPVSTVEVPEDLKDLDREAILEKVKAERLELVKAKEAALNQSQIAQALKDLRQPVQPQASAPLQPGETMEQFKARYNEKFYDNPFDSTMEFQRKQLLPEIQRIMVSNMQLSRKLAMLDPDRKDTFALYMPEIDDMVARLPMEQKLYDADVYTKLHDIVISRHVNEIVDRKVKEAVAQQGSKTSAGKVSFSEGGTAPRPTSPVRSIVLSRKEQDWAKIQGLTPERAGEFLLRHPEKRIK